MEGANMDVDEDEILRRMAQEEAGRAAGVPGGDAGAGGGGENGGGAEAQPQGWAEAGVALGAERYVVDLKGAHTTREAIAHATFTSARGILGEEADLRLLRAGGKAEGSYAVKLTERQRATVIGGGAGGHRDKHRARRQQDGRGTEGLPVPASSGATTRRSMGSTSGGWQLAAWHVQAALCAYD